MSTPSTLVVGGRAGDRLALSREELRTELGTLSTLIRDEASAIRSRQDDMIAQQRITDERVSQIESTVAGHAVTLDNLAADTRDHRKHLRYHDRDLAAVAAGLENSKIAAPLPASPDPEKTVITIGWVRVIVWIAIGGAVAGAWIAMHKP